MYPKKRLQFYYLCDQVVLFLLIDLANRIS